MTKNTWIAVLFGCALIIFGVSYFLFWQPEENKDTSVVSPPLTDIKNIHSSESAPDQSAEEITMTGELVCLPHKDASGPQTLECAFGLLDDSGTYFALQDMSSDFSLISQVATGDIVRVSGTRISQPSDTYNTSQLIKVESVEKVQLRQ